MRSAPAGSVDKTILLFIVSIIFAMVLLEVGSLFLYRQLRGRPFSRADVQGRLLLDRVQGTGSATDNSDVEVDAQITALKNTEIPDSNVIIHPYFGFIINPESPGINRYGFFQDEPFTKRADNRVVIVIFGGSLADQVFYLGQDAMAEQLRHYPFFANKDIKIVSVALGGYKQPQQLLILSYLLTFGAQYDIVVNIDGYNEIDSSLDNFADGLNPFYPHNWKLHARQGIDTDVLARVGRIELTRDRRRQLRSWFAHVPLRNSVFFLTLWDVLDQRELADLRREMAALDAHLTDTTLPPRVRGPATDFEDDESVYHEIALVWARASLNMSRLSEAHDIAYFHFLQPNQYVPDSKPFTAEELRVAVVEDYPGRERVMTGFPQLQDRGEELRELGVNFFDLTPIFKEETRTIYNDFCCHVNELGAKLIARSIADTIATHYPEE